MSPWYIDALVLGGMGLSFAAGLFYLDRRRSRPLHKQEQ